jgi:hypothetical protein
MAWDGATWTQIATANEASPRAASGPAMSNDPLTGHIDQFGGFDGFLYQDITWCWSETNWIQVQTAAVPYARAVRESPCTTRCTIT